MSSSITSSTGWPALTMMRIGRGFAMLSINSGSPLAGKKRPSLAMLGDQRVGPLVVAVEDGDAEPMPRRVSRQICAHDGQSKHADVSLISHRSLARSWDRTPS